MLFRRVNYYWTPASSIALNRIKLIKILSLRDELVTEIEESKRQLDENDIDSLLPSAGLEARYVVLENKEKLLQIIPKLYEEKLSIYLLLFLEEHSDKPKIRALQSGLSRDYASL